MKSPAGFEPALLGLQPSTSPLGHSDVSGRQRNRTPGCNTRAAFEAVPPPWRLTFRKWVSQESNLTSQRREGYNLAAVPAASHPNEKLYHGCTTAAEVVRCLLSTTRVGFAEKEVIIPNEVLWRNVFGEPVDLDDIDREYALAIYTMVVMRRTRFYEAMGLSRVEQDAEIRVDALVQKLREVILKDAKKRPKDRRRALFYNRRAKKLGLRWRASG